MSHPVTIYTTVTCPYCIRAKQVLNAKQVKYSEIDVTEDPETRKFLVEATGQRTVPQIFIGGKSIGGCDDMIALDRQGKLDEMLKAVTARQSEAAV
jgi:glutaredoxin 3